MNKNSSRVQPVGKLITFNPTGEFYFNKGIKAYHQRDYYKSLKYLQRALALEPGEPMIACQLAVVYADVGEYQKSNELLHVIIEELDEDMVECYYFLANNYAHLGFFKDAYYHAKLYLSLDKDGEFVEDTEDLMEVLSLESDELEEEEAYEEEDLITRQEQARALLESGNFSKAVEVLTKVIQDYPEYWSAYNNLALAHFYLGQSAKASEILEHVLTQNIGNLHALCNTLVFAYYQNDDSHVKELAAVLKKINPISIDHQFKLGTTFALIGEYDIAYFWLKKIYKRGFQGDGSFYYWLSYAAYYTGNKQTAKKAWKKVIDEHPEKEGQEPWNNLEHKVSGFEEHLSSILKRFESNHVEERLFATFLTSVSSHKEKILSSSAIQQKNVFTKIEQDYLAFVKAGTEIEDPFVYVAHHTAEQIYANNQPIGTEETSLYLLWFSAIVEMHMAGALYKNCIASAAAIDYLWNQTRVTKKTQQEIADQYGLSPSTLQKYIKLLKSYMQPIYS